MRDARYQSSRAFFEGEWKGFGCFMTAFTQKAFSEKLDSSSEAVIQALADEGHLDAYRHVRFTELIQGFNEVLSSCERLKKTPFPMQYTWFVYYTLVIFLFVLPLSLAGHLGYWSVPFSLLIGYAYIMLEYVGRHIENPFENAVNDVPMDYLARTIEIDLRELLGEQELPDTVRPVGKGYLY